MALYLPGLTNLLAVVITWGIAAVLLEAHTSAVSIGAIPRRLMVADADYSRARRVLQEAGESER